MRTSEISIVFPVMPLAVQSVRFASAGGIARKYQPQKSVSYKRALRYLCLQQLPVGFEPWDCPLKVEVQFIYPAPKSFSQKKIQQIKEGEIFYKYTRPDLQDNLMKATSDALTGIIWSDDSRICVLESTKIYGLSPEIRLKVVPLKDENCD